MEPELRVTVGTESTAVNRRTSRARAVRGLEAVRMKHISDEGENVTNNDRHRSQKTEDFEVLSAGEPRKRERIWLLFAKYPDI